ncbi:MAG: glycosyltransferase family 4 protein [Leucobacter sp.]
MRILLFTHYYEPEVGAPQRRWRGLVESFTGRGHQVAVCAPIPHYPHRSARDLPADSGALGRWSDGARGERIMRLPYSPTSGSMAGQIVDHAVSSAAMVAASATLRGARPDVIVSTTPGLPMPFAASAAARMLNVPHVAEVRDAWPDLISDARLVHKALRDRVPRVVSGSLEDRILPSLFHTALRRADAVVTTTDSFTARLRRRGMNRVETIRNTSEVVETTPVLRKQNPSADLHMLYVGTVGRSQGLETVIRAVGAVPGIRLRIVGAGAEREALRVLASTESSRIEFFPQTTGDELDEHWAWAHTGLVSLADVPAYEVTVPSKLMSIMARGVHVTGVVAGEAAQVIRDAHAGVVSAPGDEDGLRAVLTALRDNPDSTRTDRRPRAWLHANASPHAASDAYERLLEDVRV